jgi:putative membrane protein
MGFKEAILIVLKGMSMGAANVIPGVSGGTMALITGIFERLINAIKSFNLTAIRLLLKGKIKDFINHTDLYFLIFVFLGLGVAMISIAKLFEYIFEYYPVYIWAFFFGLVLSSVFFLAREIKKRGIAEIFFFLTGAVIAIMISILSPASENTAIFYLFICGVLAACSMILPGLSGSFVLILLGNYQLIMIDAVGNLKIDILIPVVIGGFVGLMGFSYLLSWVFKKFRDVTMSTLTGFVLGSLLILWPWKKQIFVEFGDKEKLIGYDWQIPEFNQEFYIAIIVFFIGIISIWLMESLGNKIKTEKQ